MLTSYTRRQQVFATTRPLATFLSFALVTLAGSAMQVDARVTLLGSKHNQASYSAARLPPTPPKADWIPNAPFLIGARNAPTELPPLSSAELADGWNVAPTGAFEYEIPLNVPPGRAGMQPSLSLSYGDSRNGPLGAGWTLSGAMSAVTRCGRTLTTEGYVGGVNFNGGTGPASDRFCLDGKKLVAIEGEYGSDGAEYRTEPDAFLRIHSYFDGATQVSRFVVKTRGGKTSTYRAVQATRYIGEADGMKAIGSADLGPQRLLWLLDTVEDRAGNAVRYVYDVTEHAGSAPDGATGTEVLIDRIEYTSNRKPGAPKDVATAYRKVQFVYEAGVRPDVEFAYANGAKSLRTKRLSALVMHAPNADGAASAPVWKYEFAYQPQLSKSSGRSLLASVRRCATDAQGASLTDGCTWSKKFEWTASASAPTFTHANLGTFVFGADKAMLPGLASMDVNADGIDDLIIQGLPNQGSQVRRGVRYANGDVAPLHQVHANPIPFIGGVLHSSSVVDFDGNGASEMWTVVATPTPGAPAGAHTCSERLLTWDGDGFDFASEPALPSYHCGSRRKAAQTRFLELDGDGRPDMLMARDVPSPYQGFDTEYVVLGKWDAYRNTGSMFELFASTGVQAGCPTHVLDTDGDGLSELITGKVTLHATKFPDACLTDAVQRIEKKEGLDEVGVQTRPINSAPWPTATYTQSNPQQVPAPKNTLFFGDFNGDGLTDALNWQGGVASLRWGTGNGFTPATPVSDLTLTDDVRIIDANRDGRSDLFMLRKPSYADPYNPWQSLAQMYLSDGHGAFIQTAVPGGLDRGGWVDDDGDFRLDDDGDGTIEFAELDNDQGFALAKFGDFNGDGFTDWASMKTSPLGTTPETFRHELWLYTQTPTYADRLSAVYDAAAEPTLSVTYDTRWAGKAEAVPQMICKYPIRCVRSGIPVVREIKMRMSDDADPARKWQRLQYSYANYRTDVQEGALGFETFWVFDPKSKVEVKYEFNHRPRVRFDQPGRRFYNRAPRTITTAVPIFSADQLAQSQKPTSVKGRVTRSERLSDEWRALNGGKTWVTFSRENRTSEWEQTLIIDEALTSSNNLTMDRIWNVSEPDVVLRRVDETSKFDDFGNLVEAESRVDGGSTQTRVAMFDHDAANWWSLQTSVTVTDREADPATPARTRHATFSYTPLGYVKAVAREPDATDPTIKLETTFDYDDYGLVKSVSSTGTNAKGALETRTTNYGRAPWAPGQPAEEIFVSQSWIDHALPFSSWVAVHPAYGVPVATQNAIGLRRWAKYDYHGRPVVFGGDAIGSSSITFAARPDTAGGYSGTIITARQLDAQGGVQSTASEVRDALGRVLKTTAQGFEGSPVHVRALYDAYGRMQAVSRPYDTSPLADVKYQYDALGRMTAVLSADGTKRTYQHSFFATDAYDPLGNRRRSVRDVHGRTIENIDYLKQDAGTIAALSTRYVYGASGMVEQVIDPQGNVSSWLYDRLGRTEQEVLPGTGKARAAYDSFGAVRSVERSDGVTEFEYDALGRVLSQSELDASGLLRFKSAFVWDTAPNGLGTLAKTSAQNGPAPLSELVTANYFYDDYGRLITHETDVAGRRYKFAVEFDDIGRPVSQAYPAIGQDFSQHAFRSCYDYTAFGDLAAMRQVEPSESCTQQGALLWQVNERNLDGALTEGVFGNGLVTTRSYEPIHGRLKSIEAHHDSAPLMPVFALNYDYQSNGLVKEVLDAVNQRAQSYQYDSLARLKRWDLTTSAGVQSTGYGYDILGNLTEVSRGQSMVGLPAALSVIERNHYAHPGKPHAVSRHEKLSSGKTFDYSYDGLGRQVKSSVDGQSHRAIDYVAGGLLPRSLKTTQGEWRYTYDAFGKRVKKTGPDGTTISIGPFERRERGAEVKHVLHLEGSDGAVGEAVFDGSNPTAQILYTLSDSLGSGSARADATGKVEHLFHEPFGKRIDADGKPVAMSLFDPLAAITRGFTGHRMEYYGAENELIDMSGRIYDPNVSRFLAPDPVIGAGQAANRYSYVYNSPMNLTDPSGYQANNASGGCNIESNWAGCAPIDVWVFGSRQSISSDAGATNSTDMQAIDNLSGGAGDGVGGTKWVDDASDAPQSGVSQRGQTASVESHGAAMSIDKWLRESIGSGPEMDWRCDGQDFYDGDCQETLDSVDELCNLAGSRASGRPHTWGCSGNTLGEKSTNALSLVVAEAVVSAYQPGGSKIGRFKVVNPNIASGRGVSVGSNGYRSKKGAPVPKHGGYEITHGKNPDGSVTNCVNSSCDGAVGLVTGLSEPTPDAPGVKIGDITQHIKDRLGRDAPLYEVPDAREAVAVMRAMGPGSAAIFTQRTYPFDAHAQVIYNDGGIIRFYDFQEGTQGTANKPTAVRDINAFGGESRTFLHILFPGKQNPE